MYSKRPNCTTTERTRIRYYILIREEGHMSRQEQQYVGTKYDNEQVSVIVLITIIIKKIPTN